MVPDAAVLRARLGSELADLWGQNAQPVISDVDGDDVDDVIVVYDSSYQKGVMFTDGGGGLPGVPVAPDYSILETEQHGTFYTVHARTR